MDFFQRFRASHESSLVIEMSANEPGCQGSDLSCAPYERCVLDQGTCVSYLTRKVEKQWYLLIVVVRIEKSIHKKLHVCLAHSMVSTQQC